MLSNNSCLWFISLSCQFKNPSRYKLFGKFSNCSLHEINEVGFVLFCFLLHNLLYHTPTKRLERLSPRYKKDCKMQAVMPHACLFCGQNIEACIAWHTCEKETRFTKQLIKVISVVANLKASVNICHPTPYPIQRHWAVKRHASYLKLKTGQVGMSEFNHP